MLCAQFQGTEPPVRVPNADINVDAEVLNAACIIAGVPIDQAQTNNGFNQIYKSLTSDVLQKDVKLDEFKNYERKNPDKKLEWIKTTLQNNWSTSTFYALKVNIHYNPIFGHVSSTGRRVLDKNGITQTVGAPYSYTFKGTDNVLENDSDYQKKTANVVLFQNNNVQIFIRKESEKFYFLPNSKVRNVSVSGDRPLLYNLYNPYVFGQKMPTGPIQVPKAEPDVKEQQETVQQTRPRTAEEMMNALAQNSIQNIVGVAMQTIQQGCQGDLMLHDGV